MTVLGVTDPRTWSAVDWISDLVPHLAYAAVVTTTMDAFDLRDCRRQRQPRSSTPPGTGASGSYGVRVKTNVSRSRWSSAMRSVSPGEVAVQPDPRAVVRGARTGWPGPAAPAAARGAAARRRPTRSA